MEKEIRSTNYFNETGPKVDLEENITSMHYFGSKALEEAFEKVNFTGVGNILDAGSGFGGCARFWAEKLGKTQKDSVYHLMTLKMTIRSKNSKLTS